MSQSFGPREVRIAEAVYRSEAHCMAAGELYGAGHTPDALLQAARPMTDVFPWLETELRSSRDDLKRFMGSVVAIGRKVRRGSAPLQVRRALKEVSTTRNAVIEAVVGPDAKEVPFVASVAVALLRSLVRQYRLAISKEDIGGYHAAYALTHSAVDLLATAGSESLAKLRAETVGLEAAFPSAQPPRLLARPESVEEMVERIAERAEVELGARSSEETLGDALGTVERLLEDVLESYERGVAPLSARLAASLFVRSYDPIRARFSDGHPEIEPRVTDLLGVEIRRGINEGIPVERLRALVDEVRTLLGSAV